MNTPSQSFEAMLAEALDRAYRAGRDGENYSAVQELRDSLRARPVGGVEGALGGDVLEESSEITVKFVGPMPDGLRYLMVRWHGDDGRRRTRYFNAGELVAVSSTPTPPQVEPVSGGEAVATVGDCASVDWHQGGPTQLAPGTKLYTHPAPVCDRVAGEGEIEALRKDAERMAYLRDPQRVYFVQVQRQPDGEYVCRASGEKVRACIDAAIASTLVPLNGGE